MIPPDFTLEYVALSLSVDEDDGLVVWTTDFQAALDAWDLPRCTNLLQIAKSQVQSEIGRRLVKYAEGQYADQGSDWPRAIRCYEQSLEATRQAHDPNGVAQILSDLGLVYQASGQWVQAIESYQEALHLYRTLDNDPNQIADLLGHLSAAYTTQGQFAEAKRCLDEAFSLVNDPESRANLLSQHGLWWQSQDQRDEARRCFTEAIGFYRAAGNAAKEAQLLNNLGLLLAEVGDFAEAKTAYTNALALAQQQNNLSVTNSTLGNLALLSEMESDFETAIMLYTETLANLKVLGDLARMATTYANRGRIHIELADWGAATSDYRESLHLMKRLGNQGGQAVALDGLGLVHRHQDDLAKARSFHEKALALAQQAGNRRQIAASQSNIGHVLAAEGDTEQAIEYYQQSLEATVEIEDLPGESLVLLNLCIAYFGLADYGRIPPLICRARPLASRLRQYDILAKLAWLEGDLVFFEEDNEAGFAHYRQACVWAAQYSDDVLEATVERIDIYLETFFKAGQRAEAIRFCQALQPRPEDVESAEWQPVEAYFSELEAALSDGDVTADSSAR